MKWLLAVGLLVLASMVDAHLHPLCESFFTYHNGSCYRQSTGMSYTSTGAPIRLEGLPFGRANAFCKSLHPDAHLVVVNDAAEHEWLFNMYNSLEPVETWIGLFYNATAMAWQWVNGDPTFYLPWEPYYGEPLLLNQAAAMMFASEVITPQTTLTYGYGIEVSDYFKTELGEEEFPFICEYSLGMMMDHNTTFPDTGNTTNATTTAFPGMPGTNTTTPMGRTMPPTFPPQVLFQQEARPMRLSNPPGRFGFLREVTAEERKQAYQRKGGPMAYRQGGPNNNGHRYNMAMP